MTFEERIQQTSPYLLCWIDLAMTPKSLTGLYDLKRIKRLAGKDFPVPHSDYTEKKLAPIQEFLKSRTGNWDLLGEMTALQVLDFPKRTPAGVIDDFSFLPKLTSLRQLDLTYTGFSDCALLAGLTNLKRLHLPARSKLIHTEALDGLSCEIRTNEPHWKNRTILQGEPMPTRQVPDPLPDTVAIRSLEYVRLCPPGSQYKCSRHSFAGEEITLKVLEELLGLVRAGQAVSVTMERREADGAEFFTVDMEEGWSAPVLFNGWDEADGRYNCQPLNGKYIRDEEDAVVQVGGQTPIPKRYALDDPELTALCVGCFARTGQLYPGIHWLKWMGASSF